MDTHCKVFTTYLLSFIKELCLFSSPLLFGTQVTIPPGMQLMFRLLLHLVIRMVRVDHTCSASSFLHSSSPSPVGLVVCPNWSLRLCILSNWILQSYSPVKIMFFWIRPHIVYGFWSYEGPHARGGHPSFISWLCSISLSVISSNQNHNSNALWWNILSITPLKP